MNCMTMTSFSQPVAELAGLDVLCVGDRRKQRCSPKTKWRTPGTKIELKPLECIPSWEKWGTYALGMPSGPDFPPYTAPLELRKKHW